MGLMKHMPRGRSLALTLCAMASVAGWAQTNNP